jgi:LacI family transcriptional regulator
VAKAPIPDKQKNTTLADVARRAGVSSKTVSRVINNNDYVSAATRQKILEAVEALDYRPHRAARSLASNRSLIIGLTIPDITNPFFPEMIRGVERVAMDNDYNTLIYNTELIALRDHQAFALLEETRVDGIIVCSMRLNDAELRSFLERQPSAVLVNRVLPGGPAGVVRVDFYNAMRQVTQYLLDCGRRALGYLTISHHDFSYSSQERFRGFRDTLHANDLPLVAEHVWRCAATVEDSFRAASEILRDHLELDALICFNDMIASGVLEACAVHHVPVPDQLAVTGFDNVMFSPLLKTALTTVHVDKFRLGVHAAQMLFDQINGRAHETEIILEAELVLRQSTP